MLGWAREVSRSRLLTRPTLVGTPALWSLAVTTFSRASIRTTRDDVRVGVYVLPRSLGAARYTYRTVPPGQRLRPRRTALSDITRLRNRGRRGSKLRTRGWGLLDYRITEVSTQNFCIIGGFSMPAAGGRVSESSGVWGHGEEVVVSGQVMRGFRSTGAGAASRRI